jgi:hypothetical protein
MDEVISMYLSGLNCYQVAEAFHHILKKSPKPEEVIRRRLKRAGISRRPDRGHGKRNGQWKGGKKATMHYHRRMSYEVAAICLGRPLEQGWVIHHCDENPMNNNPENLVVWKSQAQHADFHQKLLKIQRAGQPVDATRLALETGALELRRPESLKGCELHTGLPDPSKRPEKIGRPRKVSRPRRRRTLPPESLQRSFPR